MIEKKKAEDLKNQMVCAAFVGWQRFLIEGESKSFSEYLDRLGLGDEIKLTKNEKERIIKKAYETGERVMNLFKGEIK
jgi:hypothetical protein